MADQRRNDRDVIRQRALAEKRIRRAAAGYHRLEDDMITARTRLYQEMRQWAHLFTELALVALSGVSRPTIRKKVLDKDP